MKGLCLAIFLGMIALIASSLSEKVPLLIDWINSLGFIAPIVFLAIYCGATVFFMPTMVVTLAGGAIFGPILGTFFNLVGATIGAAVAFIISRYWFRNYLVNRNHQAFNKLILGVENHGWLFIALLRLLPIIPFNLVNYGLGLTRIKFHHYLIITFLFLIPLEVISTYFGYAGMDWLLHSSLMYKKLFLYSLAGISFIFILFKMRKSQRSKA